MSYRSKLVIQNLVKSRKQESIRIHTQYIDAMEIRTNNEDKKELIRTILSDLPADEQVLPYNLD